MPRGNGMACSPALQRSASAGIGKVPKMPCIEPSRFPRQAMRGCRGEAGRGVGVLKGFDGMPWREEQAS